MTQRGTRRRQPAFDAAGLPEHGAAWDEGIALRVTSKGPGVPVEVRPPRPGPVRRVVSGNATAKTSGGKLMVIPSDTAAGEVLSVVVEF